MFMFHIALSFGLITLTVGSALYVYSKRMGGAGTGFASFIAIIVILLSLISSACILYCGVKAWQQGGLAYSSCMMHDGKMQDKTMMNDTNNATTATDQKVQTKTVEHTRKH